jgi:hypothetical protein
MLEGNFCQMPRNTDVLAAATWPYMHTDSNEIQKAEKQYKTNNKKFV